MTEPSLRSAAGPPDDFADHRLARGLELGVWGNNKAGTLLFGQRTGRKGNAMLFMVHVGSPRAERCLQLSKPARAFQGLGSGESPDVLAALQNLLQGGLISAEEFDAARTGLPGR